MKIYLWRNFAAGYKEFHNYLSNFESSPQDFSKAVDRMKLSTRQYAKRQISWIRNKLIPTINSANRESAQTAIYLLDATGHSLAVIYMSHHLLSPFDTELGDKWTTNVQEPAIKIMQGECP